jgi:hypothetical protein
MSEPYNKNTFSSTYRDDFRESDGYYRILFNNGRLLQARELTQLQTIIQTGMKRFADNIFKEGAAVDPGGITVNNKYQFIKLAAATSLPANKSSIVGTTFTGQTSGVQFRLLEAVDADDGEFSETGDDPPTLFVAYTNTTAGTAGTAPVTVSPGETISNGSVTYTVQSTNTVANPATGVGCRVSVESGSFYALGFFIFVDRQSKILSKYTPNPGTVIGFVATQDIVTVADTNALYDNSNEVPNLTAPGADRYRIRLVLRADYEADSDENFIYIATIRGGTISDVATGLGDYNRINDLLALRTKEESGDYVAKRFVLLTEDNDSDNSKIDLTVSEGVAYVNGYRASVNVPTVFTVNKPRTTEEVENQAIPATYGNYVKCDGGKGLRNINTFELVNLRNAATYGGSTIGTARVRAFDNEPTIANGLRYYLFDIQMNAGENFRDVQSFGTGVTDYADIIQENSVSVLYETLDNNLLFFLPRTRAQSINDISLTVQRRFTASTDSDGDATINLTTVGETFADTSDWVFANEDSDVITGLSVSGAGTQAATITSGPPNSSNLEIYAYVNKSAGSTKVKTLTETTVTTTLDSDGEGGLFVDLGKADIYDVSRITETDSDGTSLANRFLVDNGQRDNFYALGKLLLRDGFSAPTGNVFVRFRYFAHSVSGDFFSVNSYSGQVNYEDIPSHRLNNGVLVSLRDVLDFRPVQGADGTYTGTGARIMQLPEPQSSITTDVVYYLPRSDVIFIDDQAELQLYEGKPSFTPITPEIPGNALRLFEVNYNPYTLNSSDYTFREIRNKGYKMTDIAQLEQRIEDVEEAVTLSLLELDAANLEVLDSNGVNRLKSGFVADNFNDFRLTDLETPEGKSGIDVRAKEMGPQVNKNAIRMVYDSDASLNTIQRGDNIYMKYEEFEAISQTQTSGVQEINPFDAYATLGRVALSPASDDWVEINKLADLINEETIRKTETRNITRYR